MNYISLYRKYRSQNFDQIVGQEHIVITLKNAISAGRLAHAYLFCGPRGTGKTSLARIFAKGLNCKTATAPTANPCGTCDSCVKIRDGHSVDVFEIDAASNRGIDEIRELREKIRFQPLESRYKVYIIDEVHMLTPEAFNALLKTLEEPPAHAVFVLATTAVMRVPATIISRCQRLDFTRIPFQRIKEHLKKIVAAEGFAAAEEALDLVVKAGEGSMRDAISLLDQLMSFSGTKITLENVVLLLGVADESWLFNLVEALLLNEVGKVMGFVEEAVLGGKVVSQITGSIIQHFRYMLLVAVGSAEGLDLPKENIIKLQDQCRKINTEQIKQVLKILTQAELDMRWQSFSRVILEVALIDVLAVVAGGLKAAELPRTEAKPSMLNKEIAGETPPFLALVRDKWQEILQNVKSKSLFGYVSLHEGEPLEVNERGCLVVAFRKGFGFHKSRLEEKPQKMIVEEEISRVLGQPVLIECIVTDNTEKVGTGVKTVSVKKVQEIFGGRVVS